MPPPTLNYASPTTPPIRFAPLALATVLLACFAFLNLIVNFLPLSFGDQRYTFINQIPPVLNGIASLAAVFLFNAALPSLDQPAKPRLTFVTFAVVATISLLTRLAIVLFYAAFPSFFLSASDPLNFAMPLINSLSTILHLALLAAAASFFYFAARRLNRRPLGIAAALAFLPTSLFILFFTLHYLYQFFTHNPVSYVDNTVLLLCSRLNLLIYILLWLALAFFTTILAFKQPRQPPPPSRI